MRIPTKHGWTDGEAAIDHRALNGAARAANLRPERARGNQASEISAGKAQAFRTKNGPACDEEIMQTKLRVVTGKRVDLVLAMAALYELLRMKILLRLAIRITTKAAPTR